jgi:hypothetical protein
VRPCFIHTVPYFHHAAFKATSQGHGIVSELTLAICQWLVRFIPATRGLSRRTRHSRSTAGAQHRMCELALSVRTVPGPNTGYGGVLGALSTGVKRSGREADHLPASSVDDKNAWSQTSTLPFAFMTCTRSAGALYLQYVYLPE